MTKNELTDLIAKTVDPKIYGLVRDALVKSATRLRQDIIGEFINKAKDSVALFSTKLNQQFLEEGQVWNSNFNSDETVPVLPDNTKYYAAMGHQQVVVLEFKPQVRTLKFAKLYYNRAPLHRESAESVEEAGFDNYRLSLPYVILAIRFSNKSFSQLHAYYRNEPLADMGGMLYSPNLPNISCRDSAMCLGHWPDDNLRARMNGLSISSQTKMVSDHFWGSAYNTDYVELFREMAGVDSRLSSISAWVAATIEDPFFILKVNWQKYKSVRELMDEWFFGIKGNLSRKLQLLADQSVATMSSELRNHLDTSTINAIAKADGVRPLEIMALIDQCCREVLKVELASTTTLQEVEKWRLVDVAD